MMDVVLCCKQLLRKYLSRKMPNSKSAKTALRKSETRRLRNRSSRSELRSAIKSARTAIAGDDSQAAAKALQAAAKKIDQAAAKGIIHKNAAARTKSRLAKSANKTTAE
ncbi:30S ribosomal protein S20 [Gimesia fumaroli]|jgi:small subunit ribosomal protein S20|uniref:Small ribosomal subunit protein bS20 n=2 Tax=Gimesia fumaroli TaxID=2527976 RepID=A0A518IEG7_9PLAN|nr:30S ribosomal protein S20 [Gimesia fumaroli]